MRTLKKFNTEAEFNTWKNSPDVRTPYTCLVQETGNVYYDEGSDDDYSITIVAKKDAWFKIGTCSMMKYITNIYINGVAIDMENSNILGCDKDSSYYYWHDGTCNDYLYPPQMHDQMRGGTNRCGPDGCMNYYPRRFGQLHHNHASDVKRFLHVNKDDVVKFEFSPRINMPKVGRYIFDDAYIREIPGMYSLGYVAKEIIIGDGIKGHIAGNLSLCRCKLVRVGKGISSVNTEKSKFGRYKGYKMFVRKTTAIYDSPENKGKIIKI